MDMTLAVTAIAAVAGIVFVAGAAILLTAPLERTARDVLVDEVRTTERRARGEGLILRRLLPPAPAALLERSDLDGIDKRLREAGRPYGFTSTEFVRFRLLWAIVAALIGALLFGGSDLPVLAIFAIAFGLGGYAFPDVWLSSAARGRTQRLERALPDMVDSMVLALDAGMDLEATVRRVGPKQQGPLGEAFAEVLAELNAGYSLTQALERLASRTISPELADLLTLVQQSRRLGVGLSTGLRTRAQEMRSRRRLRAQEAAQRAPLKMTIPLVLFFLPALMIVFLGPAILSFAGAR
jgi:tight adherence protein C